MLFRYSRSRSPARAWLRWIHQSALEGHQHQLRAVVGVELAQQAGDSVLHGVDRQVQFSGDGLIVEAVAQAAQQVFLPQAELRRWCSSGWLRPGMARIREVGL